MTVTLGLAYALGLAGGDRGLKESNRLMVGDFLAGEALAEGFWKVCFFITGAFLGDDVIRERGASSSLFFLANSNISSFFFF